MEFKDPEDRRKAVNDELKLHFKPEFLNRLDDIVIFNPLGLEQITLIVDNILASLQDRLKERDIKLEVSQSAKELIAEAGFDPVYGARPLKRAVYELIEDKIAELILMDKLQDGNTVKIDKVGEELKFEIENS
jgi:ATP-dependent Clp protease ATP-binding subunit ClpB